MDQLLRHHWKRLYALVDIAGRIIPPSRRCAKVVEMALTSIRRQLCGEAAISEEAIPVSVLWTFYLQHEDYARLCLEYPQAHVSTDCMTERMIEAFQETYIEEVLAQGPADTARGYISRSTGTLARARQVAEAAGYIAEPAACAEACSVVGYAMFACEAWVAC